MSRILCLPVLVLTLLVLYKIAVAQLFQNPVKDLEALEGSQKRHLALARATQEDLEAPKQWDFTRLLYQVCPRRSDGVAQPLYPWAVVAFSDLHELSRAADVAEGQRLLSDNKAKLLSDQDRLIYNHGRWFNLILSSTVLAVLGFAFWWRFGASVAVMAMGLAALGVLIPRSNYFQPEVLYYLLFTGTWMLCLSILSQNAMWKYVLLGLVSGLAYLAKDEVYPLLIVFMGISVVRCLYERWGNALARFKREQLCQWRGRNHFIGMVAFCVVHLLVIGPRLVHSHETFGSFFHSYPRYWAWLEGPTSATPSPQTVQGWMERVGTAEQWKQTLRARPVELPNVSLYLAQHSSSQVQERLSYGVKKVLHEFLWPAWTPLDQQGQVPWRHLLDFRGLVLGALGLLMLTALVARYQQRRIWTDYENPWCRYSWAWMVGFSLLGVLVYLLLYGWFYPVMPGERFFLSLFMPSVVTLLMFAERLVQGLKIRGPKVWGYQLYVLLKATLLLALAWRVVELLRYPNFHLS